MAQAEHKGVAEIHFNTDGIRPTVEVVVPRGTRLSDLTKLLDTASRDVISKISPRGCQQCTSGIHLTIRERFEEVIRADINTGAIIR
jgi:hypothetical protein